MKFSSLWRTITAWTLGIALTLVLIPIGLLAFLLDPIKQRLIQPIIRFWGRSIMRFCFIPVIVTGQENAHKVPAAVFVTAAAMAFATGTSWTTMAILIPLVVPLTVSLGGGRGFAQNRHTLRIRRKLSK